MIRLQTLTLDPVRAEIALDLSAWPLESGDEIRGKLVGPQCRYASTIEIPYPIRKKPGTPSYHVLIPEPSLWTPQTPFVYSGKIEWLRDGATRGQAPLLHALLTLKNTPAGWRLNGKPFEPRLTDVGDPDENALERLRDQGFNVIRSRKADAALTERAVRMGFLLADAAPDSPWAIAIE